MSFTIDLAFRPIVYRSSPRPLVRVGILNPVTGEYLKMLALVDTGADVCVFPASLAEELGFDLKAARRVDANTAAGNSMSYAVRAQLIVFEGGLRVTLPAGEIRLMNKLKVPLLGVGSFLDFFKLSIDFEKETLSLQSNSKFAALDVIDTAHLADDDVDRPASSDAGRS